MIINLQSQQTKKLTLILKKQINQRDKDELHYLQMIFKKQLKQINDINDWWIRYECIQNLQIKNSKQIDIKKLIWIYVLIGEFTYFGMIYRNGQHIQINKTNYSYINLKDKSIYIVLTYDKKQLAKYQAKIKKYAQFKDIVKKVMFQFNKIGNKQFAKFWTLTKQYTLQKYQKLYFDTFDNMIFIVLQGSIVMGYQWRRVIKFRELRLGSIFSTYLGEYFKQEDQQQKIQFIYQAKQNSLILGFNVSIFYEQDLLHAYKFIINNSWSIYRQRVKQIKRIIAQFGITIQTKSPKNLNIYQQLQNKYEKQKIISKEVATQRMNYRRIALSLASTKTTRRKVINRVNTLSVKQICGDIGGGRRGGGGGGWEKNNVDSLEVKGRSKCRSVAQIKVIGEFNKFSNTQYSLQNNNAATQRTISPHNRTIESQKKRQHTPKMRQKQQQQSQISKYFHPQSLISQKLRKQYVSIAMKLNKNQIKKDNNSIHNKKSIKYQKQFLEQYINSRRIIKLGPKKKYLFKSTFWKQRL